MRILWVGAAFGLLMAGSAASAQVTGVVTGGSTTVTLLGSSTNRAGLNHASQLGDGVNAYGNYQVSAELTPNDIVFGNNVTAEGRFVAVSASTQIAITFKNDGSTAVNPRLQSTIIPGGFGFYVGSPAGNPTQSGRTGLIGDINQTPQNPVIDFGGFDINEGGSALAGATFSLDIKSGGVTLESLSGALTASPSPIPPSPMNPNPPPVFTLTLGGDTGTILNNFRLATTAGNLGAVGYQWDATDLLLDIPGGLLAPGDSRTLTYDSTVTAFSYGVFTGGLCGGNSSCPTPQAYSGFGDPIGKGKPGVVVPNAADGITGLTFNRFSSLLPTFDSATGMLDVSTSPKPLPSLPLTPLPVPEPGTWTMMLLGAGFVGGVLRQRAGRAVA